MKPVDQRAFDEIARIEKHGKRQVRLLQVYLTIVVMAFGIYFALALTGKTTAVGTYVVFGTVAVVLILTFRCLLSLMRGPQPLASGDRKARRD